MPTAEQMTLTKPGTHLFSPLSGIQLRTSDPTVLSTAGGILYFMLSTGGKTQLKIIFYGGTPQVIAQST